MGRAPETCTAMVLDTETTGLKAHDELIEIGVILFRYAVRSGELVEILDTYSGFREPSVPIGKTAQRINGITPDMVKGAALDESKIMAMAGEAERVYAHNAPFDYRFVTQQLPALGSNRWICTMNGVPWVSLGAPSRRLDDLVRHFGVAERTSHRALDDAHNVLKLLRLEDDKGKRYLARVHRRRAYEPPLPEVDSPPPRSPRPASRDDFFVRLGFRLARMFRS